MGRTRNQKQDDQQIPTSIQIESLTEEVKSNIWIAEIHNGKLARQKKILAAQLKNMAAESKERIEIMRDEAFRKSKMEKAEHEEKLKILQKENMWWKGLMNVERVTREILANGLKEGKEVVEEGSRED